MRPWRPRRRTRALHAALIIVVVAIGTLAPAATPSAALAADRKPEPTKIATAARVEAATPTPTASATVAPTEVPPTATPTNLPPTAVPTGTSTPLPTADESSGAAPPPKPKIAASPPVASPVATATATPQQNSRDVATTIDGLSGAETPTPTPLPPLRSVEDTISELPISPEVAGAAPDPSADPAETPTLTPTPTARPTRSALLGRNSDGLSVHVLRYLPLILGAADEVGVDPAVLAALMETEGSGEDAVSPAGAMGVMQLMPDKLSETDDPFDPGTNILRAAQLVRRLNARWNGDLAAIAGAYFGAVNGDGQITEATDGFATGIEYVSVFAEAYQRWAVALGQPLRVVAIRPAIRQRATPTPPPDSDELAMLNLPYGPERDRWYLDMLAPQPVILPVYS